MFSQVVGLLRTHKMIFDAWGHATKEAEQVQTVAPHNEVVVSETTKALLQGRFHFESHTPTCENVLTYTVSKIPEKQRMTIENLSSL